MWRVYVSLVLASAVFLFIEHVTHIEFLLHMAAIPLEILLGVFLVEKYLERKQNAEKLKQLMYLKSYIFRTQMQNLFIANFNELKYPEISISKISKANIDELRRMRSQAEKVEYKSPEGMENVIIEYVNAFHVFKDFMERAIQAEFDYIFRDMLFILHFIQDVRLFKKNNPDGYFIHEAAKNSALMEKVHRVLGDGIRKFLDYAIELKEKQPDIFSELMADYESSAQIREMH